MLGRPFVIHSLNSLPTTGPRQNPCPENPDATQRPEIPGTSSRMGIPSAVQVVIPAKARMHATEVRSKMRVSDEYVLKDRDVISIVSAKEHA